jgi:hypothetical protein
MYMHGYFSFRRLLFFLKQHASDPDANGITHCSPLRVKLNYNCISVNHVTHIHTASKRIAFNYTVYHSESATVFRKFVFI